jgi:16S rRNA (cytidine1402-2'-O)-methyltransferase
MNKKVVFAAMPIGNNDHIAIAFKNYLNQTDIAIVETEKVFKNFCDINGVYINNIYEYNNSNSLEIILNGIKNNKNILVVSNDGYPNIQDFASPLIQSLIENNIEIELIPGPNAILQSLFFSGFDGDSGQFYFGGRIPNTDTVKFLETLSNINCPIVLICIPFLNKHLEDIATVFPYRDIAICIDLSKPTQKIIRGKTTNALEFIKPYRLFPFNFDIINGWKNNIHTFYSHYTLVISQIK